MTFCWMFSKQKKHKCFGGETSRSDSLIEVEKWRKSGWTEQRHEWKSSFLQAAHTYSRGLRLKQRGCCTSSEAATTLDPPPKNNKIQRGKPRCAQQATVVNRGAPISPTSNDVFCCICITQICDACRGKLGSGDFPKLLHRPSCAVCHSASQQQTCECMRGSVGKCSHRSGINPKRPEWRPLLLLATSTNAFEPQKPVVK